MIVVTFGVPDGVLHGSVFAQPQNMDVHWRAVQPFPQPQYEWFMVALAEFSDNLRDAVLREVMRQARDYALLDIFACSSAVTKSKCVQRRGDERRIRCNQVEAFSTRWIEKIADRSFQVVYARCVGVELSASDRARTDIDGENLLRMGGREQGMNTRASAQVESCFKRTAGGAAGEMAAIEANPHHLIVGNGENTWDSAVPARRDLKRTGDCEQETGTHVRARRRSRRLREARRE